MSFVIKNGAAAARSVRLVGNLINVCGSSVRCASTQSGNDISEDAIRKSVYISQSTDIFTNLALEDWFYRNYDFADNHILLLWRNEPCVVVGRHQNPWLESNMAAIDENGISLARRNSGGGTVYHDMGNLNLSFFTPRQRYNRRYNLDVICRALYRQWGIKANVNKREDVVVDGEFKQVSGSAAKLGRPNAYHHCTLLVNVNKPNLSLALEKKEKGITTNATESVRSFVKNLTDINMHIHPDNLLSAIGWEYLRTRAVTLEDGGQDLVQQQKGFQMINPTEDWFPGITMLRDEFASWEWTFGKTPKFSVTQQLELSTIHGEVHELTLTLDIENGIVEEIKMSLPTSLKVANFREDASVVTSLKGSRYSEDTVNRVAKAIGCKKVRQLPQSMNMSNMAASQ
ncbi:lipoyltransferase 1, mitochondrial isoform X1 [Neodiprion lecontei]|uniref:Lipoyltransferase 1, mitochondrial isoform X1 n=1 Tax=Neodiprion lecontei TaxID=441921 RepID=A0A6J0C6J3_NEOLC|nr:lipoyltransferase 1, mitochondrial isoform X1 [Neodiprion lecontei]